jgi:putative transposase
MGAPVQRELYFPSHGGHRKGAGRPTTGRVSHAARPAFARPAPVHITLRVGPEVWNLRSSRCYKALRSSFAASRGRFGLRLIHFSVLGNHLHLIVEADGQRSLTRGMQGLNIRIAKALNRVMGRAGRVFADHYHSRLLATPTELVNAIAYVLRNAAHHYGSTSVADAYSSAASQSAEILCGPRTWLLKSGWRRARWIPHWMMQERTPPP